MLVSYANRAGIVLRYSVGHEPLLSINASRRYRRASALGVEIDTNIATIVNTIARAKIMSFVILLFVLAGMVWLLPLLRRGRLFIGAISVLLIGTVLGPSFFAIDGPIQISLDRVLWLTLFIFAAVGWRLGTIHLPSLSRIDVMMIGIVVWFLIRAVIAGPPPAGSSPTARWLFYIAMPAGMYLIARLVIVRQSDVRWMTKSLIGLGLFLAITAIFEITGAHALVFPKFIVNAEHWEFFGRGRGPLLNPSGNGMLISIGLVATCLEFLYAKPRVKLLYAAVGLVLLGGVYATLTRSAWMGAIAAAGLIVLMYSPRWVRVLGLASTVLVGGAMMMGLKDQVIQMKRDKNLSAADAEKSMALRPLLVVIAWEMFQDRPIVGHGFGHYNAHNDVYHNDRSYEMPLELARPYNQHNVFLSVLVDTGLVGLSLFIGWILAVIGIGFRLAGEGQRKTEERYVGLIFAGTLIAYLCNGMFQDTLIIPMLHMFLFFIGGVAVSIWQRGLGVDQPTLEPLSTSSSRPTPAIRGLAT
jgi:O-antigen ligase